jgi:hypothetical protein
VAFVPAGGRRAGLSRPSARVGVGAALGASSSVARGRVAGGAFTPLLSNGTTAARAPPKSSRSRGSQHLPHQLGRTCVTISARSIIGMRPGFDQAIPQLVNGRPTSRVLRRYAREGTGLRRTPREKVQAIFANHAVVRYTDSGGAHLRRSLNQPGRKVGALAPLPCPRPRRP